MKVSRSEISSQTEDCKLAQTEDKLAQTEDNVLLKSRKLAVLEDEMKVSRSEISSLQTDLHRALAEKDDFKARQQAIEIAFEESQALCDSLQRDNREASDRASFLTDELRDLKSNLLEKTIGIEELRSCYVETEVQYRTETEAVIKDLTENMEQSKQELMLIKTSRSQMQDMIDLMAEENSAKSEEVAALRSELNMKQSECDEANIRIPEIVAQLLEKSNDIESLNEIIKTSRLEMEEMSKTVENLTVELEETKSSNEAASVKLEEANKQLLSVASQHNKELNNWQAIHVQMQEKHQSLQTMLDEKDGSLSQVQLRGFVLGNRTK